MPERPVDHELLLPPPGTARRSVAAGPRRPAPRVNAGFSLVELLIVMALMGILAAMLVPSFNPNAAEQLSAAAQVVAADLSYARSLAVAHSSTYEVRFDRNNNRYVLRHTGANTLLDALPSSPFRRPSDPPDQQITRLDELPNTGFEVQLIGAVRLATPPVLADSVEFTALGGTTTADPTVIWLACGRGENRRFIPVEVNAITGLAEIGELQAKPPAVGVLVSAPATP